MLFDHLKDSCWEYVGRAKKKKFHHFHSHISSELYMPLYRTAELAPNAVSLLKGSEGSVTTPTERDEKSLREAAASVLQASNSVSVMVFAYCLFAFPLSFCEGCVAGRSHILSV